MARYICLFRNVTSPESFLRFVDEWKRVSDIDHEGHEGDNDSFKTEHGVDLHVQSRYREKESCQPDFFLMIFCFPELRA